MIRRPGLLLAACLALCGTAHAGEAFRKPFDLHLPVDATHYYEEHFERMPYVFDETVFLFKDDEFSVTLSPSDSGLSAVTYESNAAKGNVRFKFTQEPAADGKLMMMLVIENKTGKTLTMEALLTVPGEKGVFKTTIVPVQAGLSNFESWPHPIVQLALRSFRVQ